MMLNVTCGEFLSERVQWPFSPNRLAKFAYKRINDEDEQAFDELVRRMIKYVTWFRVLIFHLFAALI